jgi:hypothetical protein
MIDVQVNSTAVVRNIRITYEQYERKAYDIFKFYSIEIMKYMMLVQGSVPAETKGAFWTNHTFRAVNAFFAKAWQVPTLVMGVNLSYKPDPWYTELLEHGHDGRFAAIPTLLEKFEPLIIRDLQILYGEK